MSKMRGVLAPGRRAAYALAGDAIITIMNPQTGTRFTYKITRALCRCSRYSTTKENPNGAWPNQKCSVCHGSGFDPQIKYFIKVLTGPENSSDYTYAGMLDHGVYRATKNSKIGIDAPSIVAFLWLTTHWETEKVEVWHEGVCGRCGRRLTVPESIESGIGPVCAARGAA